MQRKSFWMCASLFVLTISLAAQQQAAPTIPSTGHAGLDQYRSSRIAVFTDDYGQLQRYRADDATVKAMPDNKNRVIFFGDSITDGWKLDNYFPGKSYINRGIGGQTTPQMLVRFRQDVILLKPKVVVILAGANDLAGVTGPATEGTMAENFMSMVELAKFNRIRVVLGDKVTVALTPYDPTRGIVVYRG